MGTTLETIYSLYHFLDKDFFNDYYENVDKRVVYQRLGYIFQVVFDVSYGSFRPHFSSLYSEDMATAALWFCREEYWKEKLIKFNPPVIKILNYIKKNIFTKGTDFMCIFSYYCYLVKENKDRKYITHKDILKDELKKEKLTLKKLKVLYKDFSEFVNNTAKAEIMKREYE